MPPTLIVEWEIQSCSLRCGSYYKPCITNCHAWTRVAMLDMDVAVRDAAA